MKKFAGSMWIAVFVVLSMVVSGGVQMTALDSKATLGSLDMYESEALFQESELEQETRCMEPLEPFDPEPVMNTDPEEPEIPQEPEVVPEETTVSDPEPDEGPEDGEGQTTAQCSGLDYFWSEEEFREFLGYIPSATPQVYNYTWHSQWYCDCDIDFVETSWGFNNVALSGATMRAQTKVADSDRDGMADGYPSHSSTNNQVVGVDEMDSLKTDGSYIYMLSGGDVLIIKAYPVGDAGLLARITMEEFWATGLLLHGDKLVVVGTETYTLPDDIEVGEKQYVYRTYLSRTNVRVYDISDRSEPVMVNEFGVSGSFGGARMIGGHIYLLTSATIYSNGDDLILPTIWKDGKEREVVYYDIGYFDGANGNKVTMMVSLDMESDAPPSYLPVITGNFNTLYVSRNNIYMAGTRYIPEPQVYIPTADAVNNITSPSISSALLKAPSWFSDGVSYQQRMIQVLSIQRFSISGGDLCYTGSGQVPGNLLNQFSMDEHEGHLRVATTIGWMGSNNVYVLDPDMQTVGRLENLAPGERIYSARFMGDRGYLVTFKKVDPFYVIDLSDPASPGVLGYLKIPGYSDYMHPYDENHIIGLGKDTYDMGSFAWYQGLKLSLFDVTDVENPREVSKLVIGDRGTSSDALYDHKAFQLFREHDTLVIPVDLYEKAADSGSSRSSASTQGKFVWRGAYVISVTPEDGFKVEGKVGHDNARVQRSLYIDDVLYTVSDRMVKMNDINSVVALKTIQLR